VVNWEGNFNWNGRNSRYRQQVIGKGDDMKKVIIAIIIFLVLVYLALKTETVQSFFDRLSRDHKVDLIQ
jgi:hypothetical protein